MSEVVLHKPLNLDDNPLGMKTGSNEKELQACEERARKARSRGEEVPEHVSVSLTSKGIWVARVSYSDSSFDIVEGNQDEILQVRHLKRPVPPVRIPGQYDGSSAAKAIAEYRAAPKLTAEEERRQLFLAEFGEQGQLDELFEERET